MTKNGIVVEDNRKGKDVSRWSDPSSYSAYINTTKEKANCKGNRKTLR